MYPTCDVKPVFQIQNLFLEFMGAMTLMTTANDISIPSRSVTDGVRAMPNIAGWRGAFWFTVVVTVFVTVGLVVVRVTTVCVRVTTV